MIYTSYFAKIKELEKHNIIPVSICAKAPDWYKGLQYKKLAPKYGFFTEYKKNHDESYYTEHFQSEVLDKLDAAAVMEDLAALVPDIENKDIALICYEKSFDFCHRHLVAGWLNQNGFRCGEWKKPELKTAAVPETGVEPWRGVPEKNFENRIRM